VKLHILPIDKLSTLRGVGLFDVILVLDILEHVADWEAQILVREIVLRAQPGCLVYILTPVDIRKGQYKGMHFNQWTFNRLNALFTGFEIVEYEKGGDLYVVYRYKKG
jgi:2-polyprenyl-3-methyl-5-hydroxy-6-metoxy-1,4-benzoquinol methylase